MAAWVIRNTPEPPAGLAESLGIPNVAVKVMINRGLRSVKDVREYVNASMDSVSDGSELTDMNKGVELIRQAVHSGRKIRIMGDYDVDGVTSTYILFKCLSMLGADCDHFIPHRVEDGYGLHEKAVQDAYNAGVKVLLTCDNGIAASDAVRLAKQLGMTVVVTDHHEIPYKDTESGRQYILPPADAAVDPKRDNVFREICGAVVAWKFAGLLCQAEGRYDDFLNSDFLEFVSLGTVCDVMPLQHENRAIVKEGLKRCASTKNTGLRALLKTLEIEGKKLSAYDYGFIIGPCINAEGRLGTAEDAFQLFIEEDSEKALKMAEKMKKTNEERQELTRQGMEKAFELIDRDMPDDKVLTVYLPECHESIAGIIAGRIRERYNKPAFVLTDSRGFLKGSGRSIEKYSMYEELVKAGDLLLGFGGHPMAAGISLNRENLEAFRRRLNDNCVLTEKDFVEKKVIDAVLPVDCLTEKLIRSLSVLEPFGKGNEKPIFAQKHVRGYSAELIGKNRNVLSVKLASRNCGKAVCFHNAEDMQKLIGGKLNDFDMLYFPALNEWKGKTYIQAEIIDAR